MYNIPRSSFSEFIYLYFMKNIHIRPTARGHSAWGWAIAGALCCLQHCTIQLANEKSAGRLKLELNKMAHIPTHWDFRDKHQRFPMTSLSTHVDDSNTPAWDLNSRGALWPQVAILEVTLQGIWKSSSWKCHNVVSPKRQYNSHWRVQFPWMEPMLSPTRFAETETA